MENRSSRTWYDWLFSLSAFFTEPLKGHVGHSAASATLVRNPEAAAGFLFTFMAVPQSATNLHEALLSDPSGQDQDACPFCVTHNSPDGKPEGIWDRLKRMPEENMWFMTTMKFFTKRPAYGAIHLVNGYDWSALQGKSGRRCKSPPLGGSVETLFGAFGTSHSLYPALPYRPSGFQFNPSLQCGGSTGHLAAAISMKYPSLTIISQDLPPVIKQAQLA